MPQNRRNFLKSTFSIGAAAAVAPSVLASSRKAESTFKLANVQPEWRNKQQGMHYRMLGRTGLMVSEFVMGAIGKNSLPYVHEALDMGLNYFDTAPRYGNGRCEEAIGELVKQGHRERFYIATKLSDYLKKIDELRDELLSSLPSAKQSEIRRKASELMDKRGVMKYGYYYKYFAYQDNELPNGYLTHTVMKDYGYPEKWKKQVKQTLQESLDGSLKRLNTDYVDIMLFPHGGRLPEELDDDVLYGFMNENIKSGKIRFSGISIHSDVPQVLLKAVETDKFDMAMVAYNIVNQGSMDMAVKKAYEKGMGIVAMKVARSINRTFDDQPKVPQWRLDKLHEAIPGNMKPELKAYLWALQNPDVTAVVSAMNTSEMVMENLSLAGKKLELMRV